MVSPTCELEDINLTENGEDCHSSILFDIHTKNQDDIRTVM